MIAKLGRNFAAMKGARRRAALLPLGIASALLWACSSNPSATETAASGQSGAEAAPRNHPISGLRVVPLQVQGESGTHAFTVEVAASPKQQAKGLMFRTELGPNEGMIFPYSPPRPASFWMKNTPLPLDIIFVGADGRILNIAANTVPYSLDPVPSDGPASLVLEIPAGRAAELGIKPGDIVNYQQPEQNGQ